MEKWRDCRELNARHFSLYDSQVLLRRRMAACFSEFTVTLRYLLLDFFEPQVSPSFPLPISKLARSRMIEDPVLQRL